MTAIAQTSAASSKSEFVIDPALFLSDTTAFFMSSGNFSLHTKGCIFCSRANQTPPPPSAAASWYPANFGISGTISLTCVGRRESNFNNTVKSNKASLTSEFSPRPMCFRTCPDSSGLRALLIGVKKPAAAGRMTEACLSLPTVVWNFFTGVRFLFNSCLVSFTYRLAFSFGNLTVRRRPLNRKPTFSFSTRHCPSPLSSFF